MGGDSARGADNKVKNNIVWIRAGEFAQQEQKKLGASASKYVTGTSGVAKMQLFGPKVDARDICQGALGDCWLLSAMACMAEQKGGIQRLFKSKEYNPQGKYTLELFDGAYHNGKGGWRTLVIDDHIPCDKDAWEVKQIAEPIYSQPNGNELWAILLEKAFAKMCGSYADLEGGSTIWALRAMTGDLARWFEINDAQTQFQRWDLRNQEQLKRYSDIEVCAAVKLNLVRNLIRISC